MTTTITIIIIITIITIRGWMDRVADVRGIHCIVGIYCTNRLIVSLVFRHVAFVASRLCGDFSSHPFYV